MRKKGFTLIELITVLCIMGIIICISFPSIKYYLSLKEKKELDYYAEITLDFVNNSKMICKSQDKSGVVNYIRNDNSLNLYLNGDLYKKVKYPKNIYINTKRIIVKSSGALDNGLTLVLKNNKGEFKKITYNVYTDYGKIKE